MSATKNLKEWFGELTCNTCDKKLNYRRKPPIILEQGKASIIKVPVHPLYNNGVGERILVITSKNRVYEIICVHVNPPRECPPLLHSLTGCGCGYCPYNK